MAILVPRLQVNDATVARLKALASERGKGVGEVIASLIVEALAPKAKPNEAMFRLILVGERFGLGVGGAAVFPPDWTAVGGLSAHEAREIAAEYLKWKQG